MPLFWDKKINKKNLSSIMLLWKMLPNKQKSYSVKVLIVTLIGTLLEAVGISLIIPAKSLLSDSNAIEKFQIFTDLFLSENFTHAQFAILGMLLLLFVYIIKAIFLAFVSWVQAGFLFSTKAYFSAKLFDTYLDLPYKFHLQHNSANHVRNLTIESHQLVVNVLTPIILLITEGSVVIALAILLFIVEPIGTPVVLTILVAATYFLKATKSYVKKWGDERRKFEGTRVQSAQEALGAIKELKVLEREVYFKEKFSEHNLKLSLVERNQSALANIPRLWFETIGVFALTLLVTLVLLRTNSATTVIPTIGVFAVASFRMLPSANRILTSIQKLQYANAVIENLAKELFYSSQIPQTAIGTLTFRNEIELRNISYSYPNAEKKILSDICLNIKSGQSIGLIGKSGSGKSTLADVLLGLLQPSSGEICFDGVVINESIRGRNKLTGYVPQENFLIDDTLERNIAFGIKDDKIDISLLEKVIEMSQLKELVSGMPSGIKTIVGERGVRLSGGQKQRIGLARALYHDPPILILDEATSSLDEETETDIMKVINKLKGERTLIIIAHRLSTTKNCDRIFTLDNGQIYETTSLK